MRNKNHPSSSATTPKDAIFSRRDFLKWGGLSLIGALLACRSGVPQAPTVGIPTGTNAPSSDILSTVAPDILRPTTLLEVFKSQNIAVELPNSNWPVSYQEVADALRNENEKPVLAADKVTAIIETNRDGSKVWRGWYMAEPPFPLKEGVSFDPNGYHVDRNGNPIFDPQQIFETNWEKLPTADKDNFSVNLVDLKINNPAIALFARRGGVTRDGLPPNTHYFAGTEGVEVAAVEQLSLIPVPENLCPEDIQKSALTRAYRQAALELRDNPDARNGNIGVEWFNPEKGQFVKMDGRMIAELFRQGVNLSVLERLTPGYPVSPEEMAIIIGGQADKWVFEPNTGEWFFEAFKYKPGITYKEGVGPVDSQGNLLYGIVQTDSRTSQVFNFSSLDTPALSEYMLSPSEVMQADLFARAGGHSANPKIYNHSWYTWGNGDVILSEKAIEQGRLEMVNVGSCPISDLPTILESRVKRLAEDQPDKNVTALYWDGSAFVTVSK